MLRQENQGSRKLEDESWVLSSLEKDQLVSYKKQAIPRRTLKRPQLALLWGLRIYVVFMTVVLAYQVLTAAR